MEKNRSLYRRESGQLPGIERWGTPKGGCNKEGRVIHISLIVDWAPLQFIDLTAIWELMASLVEMS